MEVDGEIASYLDFPATDSDQEPLGWWKRDFHKLPRNVTGFMKTDHFAKNTKIELFISRIPLSMASTANVEAWRSRIPSQRYNAKRERYWLSIGSRKSNF